MLGLVTSAEFPPLAGCLPFPVALSVTDSRALTATEVIPVPFFPVTAHGCQRSHILSCPLACIVLHPELSKVTNSAHPEWF